ncbi:MAG TPA: phenylacetate--CoA ligase [Micromonosporaceae bacterium]|jgi:phenylacetate-CoA ligase|nr:phenylacetate--CoA ligase [Micromonosporaceae bacterium]
MIFDAVESISVDERAALQTARLRTLVSTLLAVDGGVQGARLRGIGIDSGLELTLADLPNLPTVTKRDLWDAYPFGMLAVPVEDTVAIHGSSGTSGRPTLVAYTDADLDLWAHVMARSLVGAGATARSLIHNAYGYGLFTGGLGVHHGARALGATVLPMSGGQTSRQLRLMQDLRPDVLTCTPSYAIYLGEAARAEGINPASLSIRVGVHGAEPWTDAMREQIETLLGIRALDIYGLSEIIGPGVACETLHSGGWLHVQDDVFLVEALDPVTGRAVPDGELGELTFTTLTKQALPLLRYRTGDLARLDRHPTPTDESQTAWRTSVKMSKIVGRADDMLIVRGVNVYPSEVEAVVLADPAVGAQYLLVLDERGALARLVVCCESDAEPAMVAGRLNEALGKRLGLACDVHVGSPGTLPRTEVGKAVRVLHWSGGEAPIAGL